MKREGHRLEFVGALSVSESYTGCQVLTTDNEEEKRERGEREREKERKRERERENVL